MTMLLCAISHWARVDIPAPFGSRWGMPMNRWYKKVKSLPFQYILQNILKASILSSGEYTSTECGFNYLLLEVIFRSSIMRSSQLQSTTTSYEQWRQRQQIQLTGRTPPPYTGQYPLSSTYCTVQCGLQITRFAALSEPRTCNLRNTRTTDCLCGHSGYNSMILRCY